MTRIHASQALLPDGWARNVSVDIAPNGRIAGVTPAHADLPSESQHQSQAPASSSSPSDHSVGVLLPSPVNLHSHCFQRAMAGLTERRSDKQTDSFWTWRDLMYRFVNQLSPEDIESISAYAQMEMLEAGFAAAVEFHYLHNQPGGHSYDNPAELCERISAAADVSGIGLTLLPTYYQYGGCNKKAIEPNQMRFACDANRYARLWDGAQRSIDALYDDSNSGVAAHSLRAVDVDCLPELIGLARNKPFHMHVAEQKSEITEVQHYLGERPVAWLLNHASVDTNWCLIHCTHMNTEETLSLAQSGAVAGLCPITEANLGDGIFNAQEFTSAGGCLGIGSDSNLRICLFEELRTLEHTQRLRDHSRAVLATSEFSNGRFLYEMATQGGAQAAARRAGRLETGYWADLLALDCSAIELDALEGDSLLDVLVFTADNRLVSDVWSAGRHQVKAGRHLHRDTIENRYRTVIRKLRQSL